MAHRNEIAIWKCEMWATPTFSESINSIALSKILPDVTGSRKSKMEAAKTGNTTSSASRLDAVQTATPHFRGPAIQRHYREYCRCRATTGNNNGGQLTASSYISGTECDSSEISTATPHFRDQATQWDYREDCPM